MDRGFLLPSNLSVGQHRRSICDDQALPRLHSGCDELQQRVVVEIFLSHQMKERFDSTLVRRDFELHLVQLVVVLLSVRRYHFIESDVHPHNDFSQIGHVHLVAHLARLGVSNEMTSERLLAPVLALVVLWYLDIGLAPPYSQVRKVR